MNKKKTKTDGNTKTFGSNREYFASGSRIKCHTLKSWPENFQPVLAREKTAELRLMDREYNVGDYVILSEFMPEGSEYEKGGELRTSAGEFTGAWVKLRITHILKSSIYLKENIGMLSFSFLDHGQLSMHDIQQIDLLKGEI